MLGRVTSARGTTTTIRRLWLTRHPARALQTSASSAWQVIAVSKDLARYSILKDNQQLFAAKYLTYLPDKEQLLLEIERQKEIFAMQEGEQNDKV